MKSFAALGHEAADCALRVGWLDQFDRAARQWEERGPDTLVRNIESVGVAEPQRFVIQDRSIQVGHDNADVMQVAPSQETG